MRQKLTDVLAVKLTCPSTITVGDVVDITDDLTVSKVDSAGSSAIVGTVCAHNGTDTTCTIETRFRERRDDRISGAACAVGPFVFDADMKVIAYASSSHDSGAIAGLVITAASAADETVETLEY